MKPRKRQNNGTFGRGRGVYITDELRASLAYKTLTPQERLVLLDMIRVFNKASSGDRHPIADTGIVFTLSMTIEEVDEKSFSVARRRICQRGFFSRVPELESARPGAPHIYMPDTRWRTYTPTPDEQERIQRKAARKAEALSRGSRRKREFLRCGDADEK